MPLYIEEETEEEWEKRDAAEQLAKKQKLLAGASGPGFVLKNDKTPASSEAHRDGEADNEDSTEEPGDVRTPQAKAKGDKASPALLILY